MLELHNGQLQVESIFASWYSHIKEKNYGAFIPFIGIVRDEEGIDGLSFDIYEPMLRKWFNSWQVKASKQNTLIFMAHAIGIVPKHSSSFIAAVASPKRKIALSMINDFVEDFKAVAPIWKYNLFNEQKVYSKENSFSLNGSGLLKNIIENRC